MTALAAAAGGRARHRFARRGAAQGSSGQLPAAAAACCAAAGGWPGGGLDGKATCRKMGCRGKSAAANSVTMQPKLLRRIATLVCPAHVALRARWQKGKEGRGSLSGGPGPCVMPLTAPQGFLAHSLAALQSRASELRLTDSDSRHSGPLAASRGRWRRQKLPEVLSGDNSR